MFSRDAIIDRLHGPGFAITDRTIDSHIRNLRAKFAAAGGADLIETRAGIGYRIGPCRGGARLIRRLKDFLKRHWPSLRLRTILFATLLFVAALPGIGAVFLRVYENTLVQQTEAELIAQGAVLASAYRSLWARTAGSRQPPGRSDAERPTIDLSAMPVLAAQPAAAPPRRPLDPRAARGRRGAAPDRRRQRPHHARRDPHPRPRTAGSCSAATMSA